AAVNLARLGFIKNGAANAGASGVTIRNGAATLVFSQVKNLPNYVATALAAGKDVTFTKSEAHLRFGGKNGMEELMNFLEECRKK
ncbi:MAG: hypothetical protein K2M95_06370, partial [Clostridiales bacterium]|nr:hypothetical protein [Clostridiales bacterium]